MNLFPEVTSQLREHCGEHGGILQHSVDQNQMFTTVLKHFKYLVKMAWDKWGSGSDAVFAIVVVCAHGRHRSVAVARAIHHILNSKGLQCPQPIHLGNWQRLCSRCEECSCTSFSRTKQEALAQALALYDTL